MGYHFEGPVTGRRIRDDQRKTQDVRPTTRSWKLRDTRSSTSIIGGMKETKCVRTVSVQNTMYPVAAIFVENLNASKPFEHPLSRTGSFWGES